MRRKNLSFLEETVNWDNIDVEAAWPELRAALREPANTQDLGLWRLAETSAAMAHRRATLLRPISRTEPPSPELPDAA